MRYFMVASFLGLLCAGIIGLGGEQIWYSRWNPYTLALTHALVLGVFSMVMCGALLQLVSVLGGQSIVRVRLISTITLLGLTSGTLSLISGFLLGVPWLIACAFVLIICSVSLLLFSLLASIGHTNQQQHSLKTIRLAIGAVLLVILIASVLVSDHFFVSSFNQTKHLTDSHAGMGLVGWISLLIMGVSFQVLPMFHVAPAFPRWSQRQLPLLLFFTLIARLLFSLSTNTLNYLTILDIFIEVSLLAYALTAAKVIYTRKRKIPDLSISLWYIALASLTVCMLLSLFTNVSAIFLVGLFCVGWVLSIMLAMLVKIAPFLAYIHLQRQCGCDFNAFELLPNVHQLLSKAKIKYLFFSHCATMCLLITTLLYSAIYPLLAISVGLEFGYLAYLLFGVSKQYHQVSRAIGKVMDSSPQQ